MLPSLSDIRKRRESLGILQKDLAKVCGIKSSTLNMIENEKSEPSVKVWRKIDSWLDKMEAKSLEKIKTIGKICNTNIVSVRKTDYIHVAIKKMRDKSVSQLLVFDYSSCIGIITDSSIVDLNQESDNIKIKRVKDAMEPMPVIVDWDRPIKKGITSLIKETRCILVSKDNKIKGIVTPEDLLP